MSVKIEEIFKDVDDSNFHLVILDEMEKLVDHSLTQEYSIIRDLALDIVKDCASKDYACEAKKIFNWVLKNIRYVRDITTKETLHSAANVLREKQTDCDGFAILLASLLMSIGHECRFSVIRGNGNSFFHHVYCEVELDGKWYSLDPSDKNFSFGQEYPYEEKMIYNIKAFHGMNGCNSCMGNNDLDRQKERKRIIIKNLNQSYQKQLALGIDPVTAVSLAQNAPEIIDNAKKQVEDIVGSITDAIKDAWNGIKGLFDSIFGGTTTKNYDLSKITFDSVEGYLFWKSTVYSLKQRLAQEKGEKPIDIMDIDSSGQRVKVGEYYPTPQWTNEERDNIYLKAIKMSDDEGYTVQQKDNAATMNKEYARTLLQNKIVSPDEAGRYGMDYLPKIVPKPPISPSDQRANMRNNTSDNSKLTGVPEWVYFVMNFIYDQQYIKFVNETKFYNLEYIGNILWNGDEDLRKHYPLVTPGTEITQSQYESDKEYVWTFLKEKALEYISVNTIVIDPLYLSNQCTLPAPENLNVIFPNDLTSMTIRYEGVGVSSDHKTLNERHQIFLTDYNQFKDSPEWKKLQWAVGNALNLLSNNIEGFASPSGDLETWKTFVSNNPQLWQIVQSSAWYMYHRPLWELDFIQTVLAQWRNDIASDLQNESTTDSGMTGTIVIEDTGEVIVEETQPVEVEIAPPSQIEVPQVPDDTIQIISDIENEKQAIQQELEQLKREKEQLQVQQAQTYISQEAKDKLNVLTSNIPALQKRVDILNKAGINWQEANANTIDALIQIDNQINNLENQVQDEKNYSQSIENKIMPSIENITNIANLSKDRLNYVFNMLDLMEENYSRTNDQRLHEFIYNVSKKADLLAGRLSTIDREIQSEFQKSTNIFDTKNKVETSINSLANQVNELYDAVLGVVKR